MIKGWLDEKTRNKISILGGGYSKKLLEHVDADQLPEFLGGNNKHNLLDDHGPWIDYEIQDGTEKDDIVGIRKKGESTIIFSVTDF